MLCHVACCVTSKKKLPSFPNPFLNINVTLPLFHDIHDGKLKTPSPSRCPRQLWESEALTAIFEWKNKSIFRFNLSIKSLALLLDDGRWERVHSALVQMQGLDLPFKQGPGLYPVSHSIHKVIILRNLPLMHRTSKDSHPQALQSLLWGARLFPGPAISYQLLIGGEAAKTKRNKREEQGGEKKALSHV